MVAQVCFFFNRTHVAVEIVTLLVIGGSFGVDSVFLAIERPSVLLVLLGLSLCGRACVEAEDK